MKAKKSKRHFLSMISGFGRRNASRSRHSSDSSTVTPSEVLEDFYSTALSAGLLCRESRSFHSLIFSPRHRLGRVLLLIMDQKIVRATRNCCQNVSTLVLGHNVSTLEQRGHCAL